MGLGLLTGNRALPRILAPTCLFALAFAIRALPWRSVLLGERSGCPGFSGQRPWSHSTSSRDGPGAAALARHRLIYESEGIGKRDPPSYKVYEFVPGARIVGAAPAGARVRL